MSVKKNSINISVLMLAAGLGASVLCQVFDGFKLSELLFALSTGVFGSAFATLWIFVYEYRRSKNEQLKTIFDLSVSVTESNNLCHLSRFGFYGDGIKESMTGKSYIPPMPSERVAAMTDRDRCLYEMCRFVDGVLDIGQDKINRICDLTDELDFWSDSFRRRKYRNVIISKISSPLYSTFISAPAMADGYLFRYFRDFKHNYYYTADVNYPMVSTLDTALHISAGKTVCKSSEQMSLSGYMHEKLWIFRDAFFSPCLPRKRRRMAMNAFLNNTPYPFIR